MSRNSLLALGLGVYLTVAVISFPASVAYRWFVPDEIALSVIEGTVWNGSAAHGGIAGMGFSNLEWRLNPAALLTGKISVTAETDLATGFAAADLIAAGDRLTITNLSASTDIEILRSLLPLGEISGKISVSLDRLELVDGLPVAAIGEARIAELAMPPLVPIAGVTTIMLGNYRAQFSATEEPGIVALLNDQGGPIELTGRLSLAPDRSYVLDTLIRARADAPSELVQGIELVAGPPNQAGLRKFQLTGIL